MPHAENHLHRFPIPDGYQIYEQWLEVAGIQYRRDAARAFMTGRDLALELVREPNNPRDPNAIMVIGWCRRAGRWQRHHIGYVDRAVAAAIVRGNFWGYVLPRLMRTYLGDGGYAEVRYQLLGPSGHKHVYEALVPDDDEVAVDALRAKVDDLRDELEEERAKHRAPAKPRASRRKGCLGCGTLPMTLAVVLVLLSALPLARAWGIMPAYHASLPVVIQGPYTPAPYPLPATPTPVQGYPAPDRTPTLPGPLPNADRILLPVVR